MIPISFSNTKDDLRIEFLGTFIPLSREPFSRSISAWNEYPWAASMHFYKGPLKSLRSEEKRFNDYFSILFLGSLQAPIKRLLDIGEIIKKAKVSQIILLH